MRPPCSRLATNADTICPVYASQWEHGDPRSAVARTSGLGGAMADAMRVMLEIGPKGKRVVAVAPDWPGLSRGAKTGEAAIERLLTYVPRYATVAKLAGMDEAFTGVTTVDVVEQYPGTGS